MRIALVHPRYTTHGGMERYISNLARLLVERGDEVHLFVSRVDVNPPSGAVVHRVPQWGGTNLARTMSFVFGSAKVLEAAGPFDIVQGFGRSLDQDILRCGGGTHRVFLRSLIEDLSNPVLRLWERARPYQRAKLWIEERALRASGLKRVIAVSDRVRSELVTEYGLGEERVVVLHNGVDTGRFTPEGRPRWRSEVRRSLGFGNEEVVVLFLGTGFRRKGVATAIEAVGRLAGRRPEVRLVIAGRDARERHYRRLALDLGVGGVVRFVGAVAEPERLYVACDLLVLPTVYEPFGNVCLEALASGIPAVTTAVNGASEVYEGELRDLLARDPRSGDELASLIELLMDPVRRERLGRLAREVALRHTLGHHFERVFALYDEVLREKRMGAARERS